METTLDAYMNKMAEINTACTNYSTNKIQLQTLISELETIDNVINSELEDESNMPTTLQHLRKLISVEIIRARKMDLQNSLYTLIEHRKQKLKSDAENNIGTYSERFDYGKETYDIDNYIDSNIISNCACMANRCNVIKKIIERPEK